jgi:hypothetical protein
MVQRMDKNNYDKVRGFRCPERIWRQTKRAAKAKHQKPSDFVRHAIERALAAEEVKQSKECAA